MPHHTVAALLLLPVALAQVPGTQTPEHHPSLRISECTADKTCTTLDKSIVLDANWRWTDVGGTNCYTGNAWSTSLCPDPTTCASHCALEGADYEGTYGIHAAGDELQLDFVTHGSYGDNVGSRVYLLDGEDKYHLFKLKNREFSVTIDDSTLGCGLNGALYFVGMSEDGEGSGFAVDTSKKFTVVTQFLTTDGTDEGDLSEIRRFFLQDGAVVPDPTVTVGGDTFDRLSDGFCAAQKKAFGDENTFEARGGLAAVGDQMDAGMVLVMSLWDDHDVDMLWLDSTYPANATGPGAARGSCATDTGKPADVEANQADAYVTFSAIKVGAINSTFAPPTGHVCKKAGCNVCAACCQDYIGDCDACVAAQCGAAGGPAFATF